MRYYELFVHIPESHLEEVKTALFAAGAGKVGTYSHCAWQVKGEGQFKPLVGSNAYIGTIGQVEKIIEYRVHTICAANCLDQVVAALKAAHPYEMPAYGVLVLAEPGEWSR
jgi:structural toxin protein (hemagglutinin/hemolysin) RtxA